MKLTPAFALLAVAAFTAANCSDDEVTPEQFEYPLAVGSQWFYSHTMTQIALDDGETEVLQTGPVVVTLGAVETLENIGVSYRFDVRRMDNGETSYGSEYYQNRDDGLHRVAHCNQPGVVGPKLTHLADRESEHQLLLSVLDIIPSIGCDQGYEVEADAPLVLPYPIRIGQEWVFRDIPDIAVTVHKKVMSWGSITVPAGKIDAYRIKWTYNGNPDLEVEDHIAEIGLIKRVALSKNIEVLDYQNPSDPPIMVDLNDELVLDSVTFGAGPEQFTYPMEIGREWFYTLSIFTGPDSAAALLDFQEPVKVLVGGIELLSPVGQATRLDTEMGEGDDPIRGAQFYQSRDSGLYNVAGCAGAGVVTPKQLPYSDSRTRVGKVLSYLDLASPQICIGSVFVDSTPDLALPYPEQVGDDWLFREVPEIGLTIRKRITGWNRVKVPAGEYNAYRLEWIYTSGLKTRIVDAIAKEGLIQRIMVIDSVEIRTPEDPEGTGEYETWVEILALDSLR